MTADAVDAAQRKAARFFEDLRRRPALMGILNVTPDSFSDGGRFVEPSAALGRARAMIEDGAAMLDVGAESTRPGHKPVGAEEEWARLAPHLPGLAALAAPLSVDTYKAATARRALAAGCAVVNDIWGFQRDPDMAGATAAFGAGAVLMHNRDGKDESLDIVADMKRFFEISLGLAARAGVARERIALDPGIGFGKTPAQNFRALKATDELARTFDLPVLIGVSRKSLFGVLLGVDVGDRLVPTLAANLAARARGGRIFRVHDVAEHRAALAVWEAIENA